MGKPTSYAASAASAAFTALATTLLLLTSGAVAPAAPARGAAPGAPAAKRVVCFGDSITAKGYPELLAKALDDKEVSAVNAGVGGETTRAAMERLGKDVLDRKPDVVVILFGTNDSRLDAPRVQVPVAQYEANLTEMIRRCQDAGARVVVCTIPPIDPGPYFKRHAKEPFEKAGGLDKVLADYRAAAIRAAGDRKAAVVDLGALLAKAPEWLSADGVHPTDKGNEILARLIADAVRPLLAPAPAPATRP